VDWKPIAVSIFKNINNLSGPWFGKQIRQSELNRSLE
jgi:hypothetical protein